MTLSDQSDVIITKAHFPKRPKSHYENRHTLIDQIQEKTLEEVQNASLGSIYFRNDNN